MACEFHIDSESKFIFAKYTGTIDQHSLQDCISKLFSDPDFNPEFDGISDFRVASLEMGYDELNQFRSWLNKQENNSIGRWAVLVSTELGFGTIRIWEVLSEGYHESLRVFREEEDALKWLKEENPNKKINRSANTSAQN